MRVVCCNCNKTKEQGQWVKLPLGDNNMLSHGYCPKCYNEAVQAIHTFFKRPDYPKVA